MKKADRNSFSILRNLEIFGDDILLFVLCLLWFSFVTGMLQDPLYWSQPKSLTFGAFGIVVGMYEMVFFCNKLAAYFLVLKRPNRLDLLRSGMVV